MSNDKYSIIALLREEFERRESLLADMHKAQISTPRPSSPWSIKDVVAYLHAQQQRSTNTAR
ncbi:MAG: maleylpyruvate isomerase N-terminal domain-containing protein [Anaerolineae bacterium]|nr:maleylpyruvate isomerase N-terminal domain-containing protein [Anaerolineae bacterium]